MLSKSPKQSRSKSKSRSQSKSMSQLKSKSKSKSKSYPTSPKAKKKIKTVMHEFRAHKLKTHGHPVTKRKQAVAIALSEARRV